MDTLTFITQLTDSLAWPVAVCVLAIAFRSEISKLLGRIKRSKVGSTEFEFDREAEALKETVVDELALVDFSIDRRDFTDDPANDIVRKWQTVKELARKVAVTKKILDPFNARNTSRVARALEEEGILNEPLASTFLELRALRNQAAHDSEFKPTKQAVKTYMELAELLRVKLNGALENRAISDS